MSDLKVGTRVEVAGKGLKGSVSFFGTTAFSSGKWVGVTLDEPLGKNAGEVQGKRYFNCPPNHGVFVRPTQVVVLGTPKGRKSMLQEPSERRESRMKSPARTSRLQQPSGKSRQSMSTSKAPAAAVSKEPPTHGTPPKEQSTKEEVVKEEEEENKMVAVVPPQPQVVEEPPSPTPTSTYTALAPGMSMVEVDSLKAQVKDWKEKYETIRVKRQEDRNKLKEVEKMRIQNEQLVDAKNRMSKQVQEISKQLREAKKAMEEAIEAKDKYMDDMNDYHENIEMATLDKEMAEEKADSLQQENEALKERVEELQTDLEIIKAEIEDSGSDGVATNYQVKQLEEQNAKYREVIFNLKDLSSAEKGQAVALQKRLEEKDKEMEQVKTKRDKLDSRLQEAEALIDELKEQVDASAAAEDMVQALTEKNLELDERIDDLSEQVNDLEALNDMNDELQENAHANELELREEVDLMRAKLLEAERRTQAEQDKANDYVETIGKFRQLVKELQDSNQELRSLQHSSDSGTPSTGGGGGDEEQAMSKQAPTTHDYQIKMIETKTSARMVDSELSKLEVEQANEQVRLISLFIPTIFSRRGGDNDCVHTLLLVQRMFKKCKILADHVSQKYGVREKQSKGEHMLGVVGEQLTFANKLVHDLTTFRHLLLQYHEVLNKCEVELFQKMGTLYGEMAPHDRMLNQFFNHIKKDTLDETMNIQNLTKSIDYFKHVYQVHLHMVELDCGDKMKTHCDQVDVLLTSIITNNQRLRSFLQSGQETSDVAILLKDIATLSSDIQLLNKKAKRKIPTSGVTSLKFDNAVDSKLLFNTEHLTTMEQMLRSWVLTCSGVNTESTPLPTHKLSEILRKTSKEFYREQAPLESIRLELGNIVANLNGIVTSLQEGEFDFVPAKQTQEPVTPVVKRSVQVKSELTDCEDLMGKISERDGVIVELKKTIKGKNDDIQEANLRSAMFERKLTKASDERNERVTYLQQKLDSLTEDKKKKEKEFDETFDAMQNDIDQLESEKAELKERIQAQAKRSVLSDLGMRPTTTPSPSSTSAAADAHRQAFVTSSASSGDVRDSPMLKQQIEALQVALRRSCAEKRKLQCDKMIAQLDMLPPLDVSTLVQREKSKEMMEIMSEARKLNSQALKFSIPKVIDITKGKTGSMSPAEQVKSRKIEEMRLKSQIDELLIKAQRVKSKQSSNTHVQTNMTTFPSKAFVQKQKGEQAVLVGKLHLKHDMNVSSDKLVFDELQLHKFNQLVLAS